MAQLTTIRGDSFLCPHCPGTELVPGRSVIPGAFVLSEADCPNCKRKFLAHHDVGYASGAGVTLDRATGQTHSIRPIDWFLLSLRAAWNNRRDRAVRLTRQNFRPLRRPLLVNCIDQMYGHCLQKLFDVPRLLEQYPDRDIVVLVQDFARWLVPDGVAAIWSADLSLRDGALWFDDLARQIDEALAALPEAEVGGGFSPGGAEIARFTRRAPFDRLSAAALGRPVVSLIWRDDRCWTVAGRNLAGAAAALEQAALMTALSNRLSQAIADLDIAVIGIGEQGAFPPQIADMRVAPGGRIDEQAWLERYAASHVVLGVHGSNMLLPAAHAATAVELVPMGKWQHTGDTYDFVRTRDPLQALREIRFLPMSISIDELAAVLRVQIRQARMQAFWAQEARLNSVEGRRRFEAQYGHVFAYPEV